MRKRISSIKRKTKETNIEVLINIDGRGKFDINTGIPFLDHMLSLFAKHGLFDLTIKAEGDLKVDKHHTNEDIGLALGEAISDALGDKRGISRFGLSFIPMDEALSRVVLDISGRPNLVLRGGVYKVSSHEGYNLRHAEHFLESFVNEAKITLNIKVLSGYDTHHVIEAIFKGLGRALDEATKIDPRLKNIIPSTKDKL